MRHFFILSFIMLFFSACSEQNEREFIIYNINGYTLLEDGSLAEFESIAVQNGRVLQTGSSEEITDNYPGFDRINGNGNTLLPGLIDAHAHVMGLGIRELDVNVAGIKSLEETLETVQEFAGKSRPRMDNRARMESGFVGRERISNSSRPRPCGSGQAGLPHPC
jgi:predicted amidohydrolase YtcJ